MPQNLDNLETHKNLPVYKMVLDFNLTDGKGVEFVALVDVPAIQRGWLAFREQAGERMAFKIAEERRIISGPLMIPDMLIYRKPPEVEAPCYIKFPAAVIELAARKFFSQGNQSKVNIMHDDGQQVEGLVMYESFISDSTRGIAPMQGYEDTPEGTWFGSFYVSNDDVWQQIKEGKFTGFSVEGMFAMLMPANAPKVEAAEDWWNDPAYGLAAEEQDVIAFIMETLKKVDC